MSKYSYPTLEGFRWKKSFFWILLTANLTVSFIVLILWVNGQFQSPFDPSGTKTQTVPNNPAISKAAESFATSFAYTYIGTIMQNKLDTERIKNYLVEGVNIQAGIISPNKEESEGILEIVTSPSLYKVIDKGNNRSEMIFSFELGFKTYKQILDEEEHKTYTAPTVTRRLISVPIIAVSEDQFLVTDIPNMLPFSNHTTNLKRELKTLGKEVDPNIQESIRLSLQNFFSIYASGSTLELSYLTKTQKPIQGFQSQLQFENIDNLEVFKSDKNYQARVLVKYYDKGLHIRYVQPYTIALQKENERWFISDLKYGF